MRVKGPCNALYCLQETRITKIKDRGEEIENKSMTSRKMKCKAQTGKTALVYPPQIVGPLTECAYSILGLVLFLECTEMMNRSQEFPRINRIPYSEMQKVAVLKMLCYLNLSLGLMPPTTISIEFRIGIFQNIQYRYCMLHAISIF